MDEEGHDYANAAFFSRAYENLQRNLTSDQGTLVILNLVVGEAGGGGRRIWNIVRTFVTVILGVIIIPATLLPPAFPRKKKEVDKCCRIIK